jgi:hypothetical protein
MPFQKGHQNYNKGRGVGHLRSTEQEQAFLLAYYDEESEIKGDAAKCARKAGFSESVALTQSTRILRKYDKRKFQEALAAVGVNNLLMAYRLKVMIQSGADKDAINAIRLALAAKGESTDQQQAGGQVFNAPVMIIQGMTSKRLEDLRKAVPQLSAEAEERMTDARVVERVEAFKRGELGFMPHLEKKHAQEEAVHDKHGDDDIAHPEAESEGS